MNNRKPLPLCLKNKFTCQKHKLGSWACDDCKVSRAVKSALEVLKQNGWKSVYWQNNVAFTIQSQIVETFGGSSETSQKILPMIRRAFANDNDK